MMSLSFPLAPCRALALGGALLASACATLAEEVGTVTLELDGAPATFALWAEQSDWSGVSPIRSVNIFAQPADKAAREVATRVTIGFSLMNGAAMDQEVSAQRPDGTQLWSNADRSDLILTLTEATDEGDLLTVSGALSGQMGPSSNWGVEIDLSAPVALSGQFTVTLAPLE